MCPTDADWQQPTAETIGQVIESMAKVEPPAPAAIDWNDAAVQREFVTRKRLEASGVPPLYLARTVNSFRPDTAEQAQLRAAVVKYLAEVDGIDPFAQPCGLLLYGGRGTGKTHLLVAVLRELIRRGRRGIYAKPAQIFTRLKSTFGQNRFGEDMESEAEVIDELVGVDVLLIDDLGSGRSGAEWEAEKIYQIIDGRMEHGKITLVTSNWDLDQLTEFVGDRVTSRLCEMCRIYNTVGWPDWRRRTIAA